MFEGYRAIVSILIGLGILLWLYNRFWVNRSFFRSRHSMQGKTVLVTGGADGIGYETAKDLLGRGARVIIADYNMAKGYQTVKELSAQFGGGSSGSIRLMECDLRSLESVRRFAQLFLEQEKCLDVLICNAGIAWSPTLRTADGFHTVIQVNYLSHFLLTTLLLDRLKASPGSRIVFVASGSHRLVRSMDGSDPFLRSSTVRPWNVYPISKALMLLFAARLKQDLAGIDVFAVNPSWVWTSIQAPMRDAIGFVPFVLCYPILYLLKCCLAKTPATGARTSVYCAVEPSLKSSPDLYFEDCALETVSPLCADMPLAERVWRLSCASVGFKHSE